LRNLHVRSKRLSWKIFHSSSSICFIPPEVSGLEAQASWP
jgi:hypothetical protein